MFKTSSSQRVRDLGYAEVKEFKHNHVLCNGLYHITGDGGYDSTSVEKRITGDALGKKKPCDCYK